MSVAAEAVSRAGAPGARRRRRGRVKLWVGGVLVAMLTVLALFPAAIASLSPADPDPRACSLRAEDGSFQDRLAPSAAHWFGTDVQGCDYFARVVHGARVSLAVAVGAVAIEVAIGMVLGGTAGFLGGPWDRAISRGGDLFLGLPQVLTTILFLSIIATDQRTVPQVALALGILGWPFSARIFRSSVLAVRERPYVAASTLAGASGPRAFVTHVVPNASSAIVVHATVLVGLLIGVEAALAYLGVGLAAPTISWGLMIEPAQVRLAESPHLMLFPCLFIAVAILAFLLLGDGLQDTLDPREQR